MSKLKKIIQLFVNHRNRKNIKKVEYKYSINFFKLFILKKKVHIAFDKSLYALWCPNQMEAFSQHWTTDFGQLQFLTLDSQTYPVLYKIIYSYYVVF